MRKLILLLMIAIMIPLLGFSPQSKGKLIIEMWDFDNSDGKARISLFNSEDGFPTKPKKAYRTLVTKIKNKKVVAEFDNLPYGTYAVAVHHDENDNDEVDTNFLGIPNESFGASNDAEGNFGPPDFDDAKFTLNSTTKRIKIRMQ